MATKRFLGNTETGIYHDDQFLGERCNTDALRATAAANLVELDDEPEGEVPRARPRHHRPRPTWKLCGHCADKRARYQEPVASA